MNKRNSFLQNFDFWHTRSYREQFLLINWLLSENFEKQTNKLEIHSTLFSKKKHEIELLNSYQRCQSKGCKMHQIHKRIEYVKDNKILLRNTILLKCQIQYLIPFKRVKNSHTQNTKKEHRNEMTLWQERRSRGRWKRQRTR